MNAFYPDSSIYNYKVYTFILGWWVDRGVMGSFPTIILMKKGSVCWLLSGGQMLMDKAYINI